MRLVRTMLTFILVMAVAGPVLAKGGRAKGDNKAANREIANVLRFLKKVTLTAEQQTKVESLKSEYKPKVSDGLKKVDDALTPQQKQDKQAAKKKAKADGLKGKAAKAAVDAAVNLTADQKTQLSQAQSDLKATEKELRQKAIALLTPEQIALLPTKAKGKGKKQ